MSSGHGDGALQTARSTERASDHDRDGVLERLSAAADDGRLTLEEYSAARVSPSHDVAAKGPGMA